MQLNTSRILCFHHYHSSDMGCAVRIYVKCNWRLMLTSYIDLMFRLHELWAWLCIKRNPWVVYPVSLQIYSNIFIIHIACGFCYDNLTRIQLLLGLMILCDISLLKGNDVCIYIYPHKMEISDWCCYYSNLFNTKAKSESNFPSKKYVYVISRSIGK